MLLVLCCSTGSRSLAPFVSVLSLSVFLPLFHVDFLCRHLFLSLSVCPSGPPSLRCLTGESGTHCDT